MCLKMINATLKSSLAGIVVGLLMAGIVAMGCGGSGGEKLTIGEDVPEIAQDATLINLEAIRGDSELLKEAGEVLGALNRSLGNTGVGSSDLQSALTFVVNDRRVILVDGTFDAEDVAKRLEDTGHGVRKIRDTEVWSGDAGNVALLRSGRMAVSYDFTTIEIVLVQLEDGRTLDQVEAAREVLDRVQGTAYISLTTRCEDVASGCRALGFSASGQGSTTGTFDLVSWYDTEAEAAAAESSLAAFSTIESLFDSATTVTEGRIFTASGEGELAEIFRGADSEFRLRP